MARSFVASLATDLGIRTQGVTTFAIGLPTVRADDRCTHRRGRQTRRASTRRAGGDRRWCVDEPSADTHSANRRVRHRRPARPEPGHQPSAVPIPATPDFATALGIPLERGRLFDAHDVAGSETVAIVTDGLRCTYFANTNPIGQMIQIDGARRRIVGVVGDAVYQGIAAPPTPQVYVPFAQSSFPGLWFAIAAKTARHRLLARSARRCTPSIRVSIHGSSGRWTTSSAIRWFVRAFRHGCLAHSLACARVGGDRHLRNRRLRRVTRRTPERCARRSVRRAQTFSGSFFATGWYRWASASSPVCSWRRSACADSRAC